MEKQREITALQAAAVLVSTIIGVGVLSLPKFAALAGKSGAPLVTFLAVLLAFAGMMLITYLGMRFPSKSIIEYGELIIGRWAATVASICIIIFFAILTSLTAREFGAVVVTAVLIKTPLEVTVIVMLLLAALSTRHDIRTFSYIHLFYTPIVLAPALLIVIFSFRNANYIYLQPLIGNVQDQMLWGIFVIASLFQGSFVYTMVIPYMRKPDHAMKAGIWGLFVSGGLYIMIVIATVSVFGPNETSILLWPTLELAKTTSLPANVLERLDAAFLAVWVTAVFTTLFSSYYLTVHSLRQLLKLRDHRMLSFFILPVIFVLAMLVQNVTQLYYVIEIIGQTGLILTIGYPIILLIIAMIRNVRGEYTGDQQKNNHTP